jgi:glycosyltransferase 2 family protein
MKKDNTFLKILKNGGLFIVLLIITISILLDTLDLNDLVFAMKFVNPYYIGLGFLMMLIYQLANARNMKRCLTITGENISYLKCIKYAIVDFFFSAITPSSSGSQPMQAYYMYKDKVSVSHASIAVFLNSASFIVIMLLYSIIGYIYSHKILISNISYVNYLFFLGICLNLLVLMFYISCIFFKRMSKWFIDTIVNILKFFRYKHVDKVKEQLYAFLDEYHKSVPYITEHKNEMYKVLLTSAIEILAFYSVTYCVYKAFSLSKFSYLMITSLQSVLYVTVSALPFPGAVGISESTFMILFKLLFPEKLLASAMILNRGVNFYVCVIITGIELSLIYFYNKIKDKKVKKEGQ